MNKKNLVWAFSFTVSVAAGACLPNDHLLVGGNDGGSGGNGGNGGQGVDGVSGGQDTGVVDPDPSINRRARLLQISGKEALTRMAGVIWNGAPDADLLSQDSAGHFTTVEDLYGPARQMLADPRAAVGVGAFYRWWLNLPAIATVMKDQAVFPEFNSALAADMAKEPETFGVNVTLPMNGTYQQLITAPFSFINERLAAIYGVAGVTGTDLRMVALDAQQRAGLLTQPGLLALTSNANRNNVPARGSYIDRKILCKEIPVDVSNLSSQYVAAGAVFNGPIELANDLAGDDGAQHCMTQQWLTFALGRALTTADDHSITTAHSAFRFASFNLKELIANIVLTDSFLSPSASPRPFAN